MLDDPLPHALTRALDAARPDGAVRYAQKSDLDLVDGFGESYLVVKGDRLIAASAEDVVIDLALADVQEVRIVELLGGAALAAACRDGREIRLIRYSRTLVPEFGVFCRILNTLIAGFPVPVPEAEGDASCRRCGNPLPERGGTCPNCVNFFAVFRRLLGLAHRRRMAILVCASLIGVVSQVIPPYLTKQITDGVILGGEIERLPGLIAGIITCGLVYFLSRYTTTYLASWLAARIIADLRSRLHAHMQKLRMGYFSKRETGELVSRVMHDTQELQHFLIDGMPYLFVNTLTFFAIALILLRLDWRLALVVFIPVPILIFGVRWIWKRLHGLFQKEGNRWSTLHTVLGESMRGLKAVKAAGQEDARARRFADLNADVFNLVLSIDRSYAAFSEGTYWIMSLAVAVVWFFAASRVAGAAPGDDLSMGDITAYVGYMWMFYGPLQWFTVIANWMNHAFASAERIFTVLDAEPEVYDPPHAQPVTRFQGRVTFDDVHFSYERGKEVIKGISLDIAPGEMVGLVGRSGAGKSTIINLLCRFFDVDSGEIRIDGTPIRDLRLLDLRRQIGIVMQEPFLFRATLLDNIRYGHPAVSFDQVVRAAKAA
ncbi:MAG: ABC transporter ATP-binding protein/permease, partial [Planctomycetes bacterium]|nr:ABC transporter ATP-binding protein/permease [Planctomycetota bacterium]